MRWYNTVNGALLDHLTQQIKETDNSGVWRLLSFTSLLRDILETSDVKLTVATIIFFLGIWSVLKIFWKASNAMALLQYTASIILVEVDWAQRNMLTIYVRIFWEKTCWTHHWITFRVWSICTGIGHKYPFMVIWEIGMNRNVFFLQNCDCDKSR